ncbi:hypothetical protein CBW24_06175 [Pacificitalea manganoxidans]|uniref:PRC-barrel domain-containing protein n=1 Tax=Pacificitalea manganoxidans TaxID=1411902 RepID=A0A291LY07_9RHOB|nr:hypothetical protein [Pacificitalea manganoxidans]ATI41626.1 hypothetical protein CBW24_06175 [Pacificitalea manganoxidans]MDR6309066.1 hypothetical protein [Pacificitalea manganoxidans]OWU71170.1 hypothetical protein ATO2_02470 [Roseovarius sp. 22II1-1F6A]|tara:strand:+ start:220 stop:837 length:618 start_codon:yes stop_codon:yes gene_type:complete
MMTKRILTTTTAIALMAGMASAQSVSTDTGVSAGGNVASSAGSVSAGADANVSASGSASGVGDTIDSTVNTASDAVTSTANTVGQTANAALDATGEAAVNVTAEGLSAASDVAAEVEAALTAESVVMSSAGETIGTVSEFNREAGTVLIDLDSEMEASISSDVEVIAMPASAFSATDGGLSIGMSGDELAAAVNLQLENRAQVAN